MIGETICRACGSTNLLNYLPLGDHPAANAYVRPENLAVPDIRYPLDTHACLDCALIQVKDPLPADYYVDYVYMPSASDTMPVHFKALAAKFRTDLAKGKPGLVIDIGSNDGLLLAACKEEGFTALGVDPSENISAIARERGIEVYRDYFTAETAKDVLAKHGLAQIIVSTNTVNHIDRLDDFMAGVATVLAEDGTLVIEVPQALTCIELNEFDTVYHEHLSTFSATSIAAMGKPAGLALFDLDELPIHGGSMRCYLRRGAAPTPALTAYLEREAAAGLFKAETYHAHAARVAGIRQELMSLLASIKADGKSVVGYSSPAKGNTLLNYYGIGPETLPYIADRNTLKQGTLHARDADPGRRPRAHPRRPARLCARPRLELPRRDPGAARGIPQPRWQAHLPHSACRNRGVRPMSTRRALVTGATGFLGQHLMTALAARGWSATGLRRSRPWGETTVVADITDRASLTAAMREVAPDAVFHLAADTSTRRFAGDWDDVERAVATNFAGTLNVIRAAEESAIPSCVIRTGGLEEYGAGPVPSVETQREEPTSPYSASQAAATAWCRMLQPNLRAAVVTLRPALTYGPGQRAPFLIPAMIGALLRGEPFHVRTGNHRRDYIYVDDVIDALIRAAERSERLRGEVINIATGEAPTVAAVAMQIAALLGREDLLTVEPHATNTMNPSVILGDPARARRLLDWAPRVGLDDGLLRTIDSFKHHSGG